MGSEDGLGPSNSTGRSLRPRPVQGGAFCQVESRLDGGRALLLIAGDVDESNISYVSACIDQLLQSGSIHVDIDLRRVEFMDARGIRLLIATHERLSQVDGGLRVIGARTFIRRLFKLVNADRVLTILP